VGSCSGGRVGRIFGNNDLVCPNAYRKKSLQGHTIPVLDVEEGAISLHCVFCTARAGHVLFVCAFQGVCVSARVCACVCSCVCVVLCCILSTTFWFFRRIRKKK
jgi:hypothetical protein